MESDATLSTFWLPTGECHISVGKATGKEISSDLVATLRGHVAPVVKPGLFYKLLILLVL
jgi:hypothetical protein